MKTYKEFITKKEPVELDEAIPLALGGIALSKWLLGGGLAATAGIAYANRNRISQTFSNMFNRKETIDDLDKLNNFWRDTKTNNDTKIDDPIGDDLKGQTFKPSDTKVGDTTGTEVGAGNQTQTINPAITRTANPAIARTKTDAKRIKPFNFKKLPKLPGTGHNVGKRVNPQ